MISIQFDWSMAWQYIAFTHIDIPPSICSENNFKWLSSRKATGEHAILIAGEMLHGGYYFYPIMLVQNWQATKHACRICSIYSNQLLPSLPPSLLTSLPPSLLPSLSPSLPPSLPDRLWQSSP